MIVTVGYVFYLYVGGAFSVMEGTIKKSVLLVGKNSLLARAILNVPNQSFNIVAISHGELTSGFDLSCFDVIMNASLHPDYMRAPYDHDKDMDRYVAQLVAERSNAHYVMLSTRKVYGSDTPVPVEEGYACHPTDYYGMNKCRTEDCVRDLLPSRNTILRLANVFSYEPGRHTFFGVALTRLKREDCIVLDVSPFVKRDFIYVDDFAAVLHKVLEFTPVGTFNLGSGRAVALGQIALWVIEGYGSGRLIIESTSERDGFLLNVNKLMAVTGEWSAAANIEARCIEIGGRLAKDA